MKGLKKRLWLSGSYTVEAAFVIPLLLGILFALIYFIYYEHDKVVLQANIQEVVIRLARSEEQTADQTEWKKQVGKNLWMAQIKDAYVTKHRYSIQAFGAANMSLDIPVMEYFLAEQQSCCYTMKVQTIQPEQMLRWKGILPETKEESSDGVAD